MEHFIVHVDMDAFFAAIEERDNPSIKGKPVIIGADPKKGRGRGVVSTCSYQARRYGVHSAQPISMAYRKCPEGIFLPPDMEKYSNVSRKIFSILEEFTPDIEPVSIDEAFMDITGSYHLFGTPLDTCRKIKRTIKERTSLTASVGMAPNKMIAKIASDVNKPDGLTVVEEKNIKSFLFPLPVERLWGVGIKTRKEFADMGIRTIGDLAKRDEATLEDIFGKHGRFVWTLANGIDSRRVEVTDEIGSMSNEHTFDRDTSNMEDVLNVLMYLSEKVSRRLRRSSLKGRTVTLKIRLADFSTYTRALTLDDYTHFADDIYNACVSRLGEFDPAEKKVRLLGVKVSKLADASSADDLFDGKSDASAKRENLHKAIDKIIDKYGEGSVGRRNVG